MDDQSNSARIFWITGYPGAGKTTLAKEVMLALESRGTPAILVDGDAVRAIFGNDLSYDDAGRIQNAWRIARLCKFVAGQNIVVVAATVSLYAEVRDWLRGECSGYREVFVSVTKETLQQRDQKGLYSSGAPVPGLTQRSEEPLNPHLRIQNDEHRESFASLAETILALR
ncbi:MAG: adenylyl-sulfate kinase [Bdellovibrionota bacterium]